MPRKTVTVTDDRDAKPMTWRELASRPAQVIINALAVYAFVHCVTHL